MTSNRKGACAVSRRGRRWSCGGAPIVLAAGTALAVPACLGIVSSAEGHRVADFYPLRYPAERDRAPFYFDPGFPRGRFRDRVVRASRQWNRLNGRFSFRAHRTSRGDGIQRIPTRCTRDRINDNFDSIIYWRGMDGRGGTLARAGVCTEVGGSAQWFYMAFDRRERWYVGRGTPPDNATDAQSVATHELGHATGFSGHFDDDRPNQAICPESNRQHTMCRSNITGTTWQRGLEPHDRHTFENAY